MKTIVGVRAWSACFFVLCFWSGTAEAQQRAMVALGERHSCALRPDRSVWCWGSNSDGQLGNGSSVETADRPVRVQGINDAVQISAARFYSCAVRANGSVWCWGEEGFGRVSGRPDVFGDQRVPRAVEGITDAVQVATGEYHACARRRDGTLWCWGRNTNAELGARGVLSRETEMRTPSAVPGMQNVTDVAAFGARTCVVSNGNVLCFGRGAHRIANTGGSGGLPVQPVTDDEVPPAPVPGITQATRVFLSTNHQCALRTDRTLWCWGTNNCSQTLPGGDMRTVVNAPTRIMENVQNAAITSGATCASSPDGALRCFGCGESAHASGGAGVIATPTVVPNVSAVSISMYVNHGCAIANDGRAWCWGNPYAGQLGIGTTTASEVPATLLSWTAR